MIIVLESGRLSTTSEDSATDANGNAINTQTTNRLVNIIALFILTTKRRDTVMKHVRHTNNHRPKSDNIIPIVSRINPIKHEI